MLEEQQHIKFMDEALELASIAKEKGNEPFGAILVKNGRIIQKGGNEIHTHTDPTNHAELGLIRDFCKKTGITDLSEYNLYTSCEPCCMCSGAMVWAHLGTLCYSVSHDELARIAGSNIMISCDEVFDKSPHAPKIIRNVRTEQGVNLLKSYSWNT